MPAARITTCDTPSCASRSASSQNRVRMMICCEACPAATASAFKIIKPPATWRLDIKGRLRPNRVVLDGAEADSGCESTHVYYIGDMQ
jgi:hypothetical protein